MSIRLAALALTVSSIVLVSAAHAKQLTSNPISHGAGFSSIACHILNTGTKPIVVESFYIKPIVTTVSHANDYTGCLGFPPYTIQPGSGCTRRMTTPSVCNPGDACYCYAVTSGSAKGLRGTMIGTVNGSTSVVTSKLRLK